MNTDAQFLRLLETDERDAFPWEFAPRGEAVARRLAAPATNLGMGRRRFRLLLQHLQRDIRPELRITDVGAFPGTLFRLVRALWPDVAISLEGLGLGFSPQFRAAMQALDVDLRELEFDTRPPPRGLSGHLLIDDPGPAPADVLVCTEVIEHQLQPLALLIGMSRFGRDGAKLYLTTNSASFIGDILKLSIHRHNVEALQRSHILAEHEWRPHMRLYLLAELRELLEMSGFELVEAAYFDNAGAYRGAKGLALDAVRTVAGFVPHLRSHIFVSAVKRRPPSAQACAALDQTLHAYGLDALRRR